MTLGTVLLLAIAVAVAVFTPSTKWLGKNRVLPWIGLAYILAWVIVTLNPALWPVALLGFVQNVAFTFVSRGRNSGSLGYHLLASIFSNGIYAMLLFVSIDMIAEAKSAPLSFLAVYTLATMSGSIFAHWLALRLERGKSRNVQEDRIQALEQRIDRLVGRPYGEMLIERNLTFVGLKLRIWADDGSTTAMTRLNDMLEHPSGGIHPMFDESPAELARRLCEHLGANAVQVSEPGGVGFVYYKEWP